jgi:glucose/arabinose dehydrogenase
MLYTGDKFPQWKGNLFMSGSRSQGITRIEIGADGQGIHENLFSEFGQRLRDVRQGPDGLIYVTTDDEAGFILRIEPAE